MSQFFRARHGRGAAGAGGCDEQHRKLINGQRDQRGVHLDPGELAPGHEQVRNRFRAAVARISQLNAAPHLSENRQQTRSGRVDADIADEQPFRRPQQPRHDEEGGRGKIARDLQISCFQLSRSAERNDVVAPLLDRNAHRYQHAFGMVSARAG